MNEVIITEDDRKTVLHVVNQMISCLSVDSTFCPLKCDGCMWKANEEELSTVVGYLTAYKYKLSLLAKNKST